MYKKIKELITDYKNKPNNKYKFSAPMPYSKQDIDKILDINNQVEKSKITSLYACLPSTCKLFTGFEQSRNYSFEKDDWYFWKDLFEYSIKKKFDIIYLLNSPRAIDIENQNYENMLKKLDILLFELKEIGVKKIRVAAVNLMSYIAKHYPYFEVLASTSLEYKTIWEYQNFIAFHPEVKQIVPSHDVNKNFLLLKNLRKRYPNIELELMVNEGCMQGCPNRLFHANMSIDKGLINNDVCISGGYSILFCVPIMRKFPIQCFTIGTHIFPWDIKEYGKIGIKNFKFVGRDGFEKFHYYLNSYKFYLKGIDNIKCINDCNLAYFTHHLRDNYVLNQLTLKECKKYLPNIKYFKQKGHLCATKCAIQCNYCYSCAEKIKKIYDKILLKQSKYISACKLK